MAHGRCMFCRKMAATDVLPERTFYIENGKLMKSNRIIDWLILLMFQYLNESDYESKKQQEIATLEQTILLQKKVLWSPVCVSVCNNPDAADCLVLLNSACQGFLEDILKLRHVFVIYVL